MRFDLFERFGMRDPRFLQPWDVARVEGRRAETDRFILSMTTTDRTELDRVLEEWWIDVLTQDSPAQHWEATQVEKLRAKCSSLPISSQEVGLTVSDSLAFHTKDEDRGIAERLLGESAAAAIRNGSSAVMLDRAVVILSDCWGAVEVLIERLLEAPAWPVALEDITPDTTDLAGLLGHYFERTPNNDILLDEEHKARKLGLLTYFWERQKETVCLNESTLVRLRLLAARDWKIFARQVEALPLRELRNDLWVHFHLHEDRDAILSLLRVASPIFTTIEWSGCTGALAALVAAIAHADLLHEQLTQTYPKTPELDAKLKNLVDQEIPEWLKQVVEAASSRPDGRLLLLFFGTSLVRQHLRPSLNGTRRWSSVWHALSEIHRVLTPKPSVVELQQAAILGGTPGDPTDIDHATYLIASAAFNTSATDVVAWYRDLLLKSDNDLCSQAKNWRRAFCYKTLGERFDQLDPFDEWRAVWKALFVTDREHARFNPFGQNALFPSIHLLRVGMELLRQTPSRCGARQFFEELLTHMRRLLANDTGRITPLDSEFAVDGIDVAPKVLGSDWPLCLAAYRHLLLIPKSRLYVATLLLEGGAAFGDVEVAVEALGHRLMDTVAELKQSKRLDISVHRLCEIITSAARG